MLCSCCAANGILTSGKAVTAAGQPTDRKKPADLSPYVATAAARATTATAKFGEATATAAAAAPAAYEETTTATAAAA